LLHLDEFIVSLLVLHHKRRSLIFEFNVVSSRLMFSSFCIIQVSSANSLWVLFMGLDKSFIFIRNNRGPRDNPCGSIPYVFEILVKQFPSMDTNYNLVRHNDSSLSVGSPIP